MVKIFYRLFIKWGLDKMENLEFRIWDVENKTMCKVYRLEWTDGKLFADCIPHLENTKRVLNTSKNPLMQYTGIKDRSRIKIFKDDIIEIELSESRAFTDGKPDIFKILVFWGNDGGFHGQRIGAERQIYSIMFSGSSVLRREIVGNRFENPELLK